MSSISSVGGYSNYQDYSTIQRGETNQKASNDAESEKLQASNSASTSAKKAEDGAMAGIEDYLKSLKEHSVKEANGTLSDEDKQTVSAQIKEYMKEKNDPAQETASRKNSEEAALSYNSHAAMELNGYQVNNGKDKEKEETDSVEAYQEMKTKQAVDSYQNVLQKQQQMEEKQTQNMTLLA